MVPPSEDSPKSLGEQVTGSDVPPTEPSGRSLGEGETVGGIGSEVAGVGGDPLGFQEIVDLESRYEILETLGRGGMGEVLKAFDTRMNRTVAIKRMLGELAQSQQAARRFLTEARAIAAINHFNIVQIHELERSAEGPYIVMEFVEGGSLGDRLDVGPLELSEAVEIIAQVCDGLQRAHDAGIVHRDIKPDNILLTTDGTPKLGDFGLARQEGSDDGKTLAGTVLGTLDFMAPEQRTDASLADPRSDQWSLAATLYQVTSGEPPRVIDLDEVPDQIRSVLQQALKTDPQRRFESVSEFGRAVREAVPSSEEATAGISAEGQCASCGRINDLQRRHCGSCGQPLMHSCLACDESIGSWEQFCGHCGASVAEQIAARERELVEMLEWVELLRSEIRHEDALSGSEELSKCGHPLLADPVEQLRQVRAAVREELAELESDRTVTIVAARGMFERKEFAGALAELEMTPAPLRDRAWLELADEIKGLRDAQETRRVEVTSQGEDLKAELLGLVEGPLEGEQDFEAAIRMAAELAARQEPELAEYAEWARQQGEDLKAALGRWQEGEEAVRRQEDGRIQQEYQGVVEVIRLGRNSSEFTKRVVDERLPQWTAAAERGLPEAQWLLGDCYLEHVGVEYDPQKAVSWLSRAARSGLAAAQASLSNHCRRGIGTIKDPAAALDWIQQAVDQDDPRGWHRLGVLRLQGDGIDRSEVRAVECFQRAMELGWLPAKVFLAHCLRDGRGTPIDMTRAAVLMREAAEEGHNGAQFQFGEACLDPTSDMSPGPGGRDEGQAVEWFRLAVEANGNPRAMTRLEELGVSSVFESAAGKKAAARNVMVSQRMALVRVPAGRFMMGSPPGIVNHRTEYLDETPEHDVFITEDFLVGRYPVTQQQYKAVMGKNPAKFSRMFGKGKDLLPVENVTWFDAIRFCNALSEAERLPHFYSVSGDEVGVRGGQGYRLPTEAEWEYAARSGTQGFWWFGNAKSDAEFDQYVCCTTSKKRRKRPRDVGEGQPNWFGLHDMCGNVWEWCWDWYESGAYGKSLAVNPAGPESGKKRVLRGGSWNCDGMNARSAIRDGNRPVEKFDDIGFRVARSCLSAAVSPEVETEESVED